ncbi:hypothetical protein Droror1_Dr00026265 [Drosera rotundifolia]
MGQDGKKMEAWCYYSSSWSLSLKLLLCMVPLILVYGFFAFRSSKSNDGIFFSYSFSSTLYSVQNRSSVSLEEAIAEHSVLEGTNEATALPPVVVEGIAPAVMPSKDEDGGIWSNTVGSNSTNTSHASNDSLAPPPVVVELERVVTHLDRLEAGLRRARVAIKAVKTQNPSPDPDYVPSGPMYWNANGFHRSYLEMEKQFKVYVYEEGEPPIFHNGPCKSIYSTEGNFIHLMEVNSQFRTGNPEKAHVFFLPFSVAMMVRYVYLRDSKDFAPIRQTVRDYTGLVSTKYPYWNRSLAADHFMLSCHDWGPETSFSVPLLHKHAIRVLCNANTSEGFMPAKDVSFPEINLLTGHIKHYVGGPSPSRRSILAFFAGGVHGPIRPILLQHWENKDDDVKVYKYLPKGISYLDMMKNSRFCLCPSGYEVASPRIVEALYTGCVPVLISDHYVPPFSDVLNWNAFSVQVSTKDIPNLKNILMGISSRQYIRMQRRATQMRRHFEVHYPPKRYDVFHMVLHSVWLRRLNIRVRDHRQTL